MLIYTISNPSGGNSLVTSSREKFNESLSSTPHSNFTAELWYSSEEFDGLLVSCSFKVDNLKVIDCFYTDYSEEYDEYYPLEISEKVRALATEFINTHEREFKHACLVQVLQM